MTGGSFVETTVVVFSYNRGRYLENAAASVRRHWPTARIVIMDDYSDDRETLRILQHERLIGSKVVNPVGGVLQLKRGGLHRNMQEAWEMHISTRFALLMQDDQQIVRPIEKLDENALTKFFNSEQSPPFLHVTFPRNVLYHVGISPYPTHSEIAATKATYEDATSSHAFPGGHVLSETGLWDVARAKESGWAFASDEAGNMARGFEMFGEMRHAALPFLAFLPNPISFRDRRITLTRRAFFALSAGLHPVDDLTPSQIGVLRQRVGAPAYGDDYLYSTSFGRPAPWKSLPFQDAPTWLRRLDIAEQKARSYAEVALMRLRRD